MTTQRVVCSIFLALGVVVAASATGQPPERAVPVRSIDDVGTLERLGMAVRRGLVPGSRVFFPFYAYDIVCGENAREELAEYSGPAFIVAAREDDSTIAYYYSSANAALDAVEVGGWCNRDGGRWHLATEHPLSGNFPEGGRYLSRDVERIEALAQAYRD